jgi:flavin-dependent dehydrogenase
MAESMEYDVAVIGAGPAGALASAMLSQKGYKVKVFEKQRFPRFSIGESLLPQSMHFIEKAGMLAAVEQANFQYKEGAAFCRGDEYNEFVFSEKFTPGWGSTFQVQRDEFDTILADQAQLAGADIEYGAAINGVNFDVFPYRLQVESEDGIVRQECARFVLDASGFGRVLPRLLDIETPADFPSRISLFTHIQDNAQLSDFDRNKILICVHPQHHDIWYWLIPFSNGRSSVGVVLPSERYVEEDLTGLLKQWVEQEPRLSRVLKDAVFDTPARSIQGYACNVKSLWGEGYALLGNAGEFLDPVFSSGVTIAMKSADLAVDVLDKQLRGIQVDWQADYSDPLKQGVDTFRTFVEAWYDGRFQDIAFAKKQSPQVKSMVSSILAGYAWDTNNPYVKESQRRINTLAKICRAQ